MKVKAKLVLGAAALSAVTSLMVWTFAFQAGVTVIRERTQTLVDLLCRRVQDETAGLLEDMADQSRLWSRDQTITAATHAANDAQLTKRLDALLAGNLSCRSLVVLSRNGKLLAAARTKPSASNGGSDAYAWTDQLSTALQHNDSVKEALRGRLVAGPGLYPLPDTLSTTLALWQVATTITRNNQTVGVLLASYSWDSQLARRLTYLLAHLSQTSLSQAQINLLDNDRNIIASTHAQLVGQPFATRQGWLSFYPATILGTEQGRLVLAIPQAPLNQAIASLKLRTLIFALAGGFALLLGLYVLGHLLLSRRLHRLLDLSRTLLREIEISPADKPQSSW